MPSHYFDEPFDPGSPPGGRRIYDAPSPTPQLRINFGSGLSSIFQGGEEARFRTLLQRLFERDATRFGRLLRGREGVFGRSDLRNFLFSGNAFNLTAQERTFLRDLFNRMGLQTGGQGEGGAPAPAPSPSPGPSGGGEIPSGGGGEGLGGLLDSLLGEFQQPVIGPSPIGPDFDSLDPAIRDAMIDRIMESLLNPGFPLETLEAARNVSRDTSAQNVRDRILRQRDVFARRGLSGSGLERRDVERIEGEESDRLFQNLTGIDLANAQAALQSIGQAFGGAFGLRSGDQRDLSIALEDELRRAGLNVTGRGQLVDLIRASIGRELGLGDLDLRRLSLEIEKAIQEFLLNLQVGALPGFPSTLSGGGGGGFDISSYLGGGGTGGGIPVF